MVVDIQIYAMNLDSNIKQSGVENVGKISGLMSKMQESVSKANSFTFAEGCATDKGLVSKHTKQEVQSGFYP
jgi:hypothetical protein